MQGVPATDRAVSTTARRERVGPLPGPLQGERAVGGEAQTPSGTSRPMPSSGREPSDSRVPARRSSRSEARAGPRRRDVGPEPVERRSRRGAAPWSGPTSAARSTTAWPGSRRLGGRSPACPAAAPSRRSGDRSVLVMTGPWVASMGEAGPPVRSGPGPDSAAASTSPLAENPRPSMGLRPPSTSRACNSNVTTPGCRRRGRDGGPATVEEPPSGCCTTAHVVAASPRCRGRSSVTSARVRIAAPARAARVR